MAADSGIVLTGKAYDYTKFAALILFPALATLYFALAQIWGVPNADKIVGSITSLDTFLGILLGLSTASYNASDAAYDGQMNVVSKDDKLTYSLELNDDVEDLPNKGSVTFKVNKTT
jgi:hypothetical protein